MAIDHTKYNIRNSSDFCSFITKQTLPPGYVLISLDVISLFSVIPKQLLIDCIRKVWRKWPHTTLPEDAFIEAVQLIMDSTYFQFEKSFFQQTLGTPMGGNASGEFADVVMSVLLDEVLQLLPFRVLFIKKYVDDLALAIPAVEVENILSYFNAFDPHIQFTLETERDNKLPFLDMMLCRHEDGSITTNWYKKPLASGRLINFHSIHPLHMKINVAKNLIHRVFGLTQPPNDEWCRGHVRTILTRNGFPKRVINTLITNHRHQRTNVSPTTEEDPEICTYKSILNIPKLTKNITKTASKMRMGRKIIFSYRGAKKLKQLVHSNLKSKTEATQRCNVIYGIPCQDCPNLRYVGQTIQKLKNRVRQHQNDVRDLHALLTSPYSYERQISDLSSKSALVKHVAETGHQFNFDGVIILDQKSDKTRLNFAEMIHIQDQPSCNFRRDVEGTSKIYSGIFSHFKAKNKPRQSNNQRSTLSTPQTSTQTRLSTSE